MARAIDPSLVCAGVTSLSAAGGITRSDPQRGFKAEPERWAIIDPWLVSELMPAGSCQSSINSAKAPFQPGVYYCRSQEHAQFTIWPCSLYALSMMQISVAPLIAGMLMLLTPRHGPAEQDSASSAPRWQRSSITVLQPMRGHRPPSPGPSLAMRD